MNFWPDRLNEKHPEFSLALVELRGILFRGLRASLSGRPHSDEAFIEDIVQTSLVKILERLDSFTGKGKFTSWALAVAIRVAFNELRRRDWNHVSLDELREQQDTFKEEVDHSPSPSCETEQNDVSDLLQSVIKTDLTSRQRDVLMAALNGMPQEEIARQLETSRNNVYKLFHDARKALKRALEKRGYSKESLLTPAQNHEYRGGINP